MFIQTESTPNPLTLKFVPGEIVNHLNPIGFTDQEVAKTHSPLAAALLALEHVTGVFLGRDFISVTKNEETEWGTIKAEILTVISDHYVTGQPVMLEQTEKAVTKEASSGDEDEIITHIKEIIETRVRPAVAQDGGDIVFHGFENGIVQLELHGACSGCPSASLTLKDGIENMLKYYIPEVEGVEAVEV